MAVLGVEQHISENPCNYVFETQSTFALKLFSSCYWKLVRFKGIGPYNLDILFLCFVRCQPVSVLSSFLPSPLPSLQWEEEGRGMDIYMLALPLCASLRGRSQKHH